MAVRPPSGCTRAMVKPVLRSPVSAARVVCCCQPSSRLSVATSDPFACFSRSISRARFVVGGFVVPLPEFRDVVVLRFGRVVIFASDQMARDDPAPPTGASPDEAGPMREGAVVDFAGVRATTLTLRSHAKSSPLSGGAGGNFG